jgi:hypothetical protein
VPGTAQEKPVVLQLKPLPMPAITEKGYQGRMTMTPYMEVVDNKAVEKLCSRLPRLMDAMIVFFEEQPVLLANPVEDLKNRQTELRQLVDETIGKGVFTSFYLVTGSVGRGDGTALIDVSGGTRECQPIREIPEIVKAAAAVPVSKPVTDAPVSTSGLNTDENIAPSSEAELLRAEAELNAEQPIRNPFPGEPKIDRSNRSSSVIMAVVLIGVCGLMMIIGSYIGYQVAKIRRERRRKERRQARGDRRAGGDRRQRQDGPPASGERRGADDRRKVEDRRQNQDRRTKRDRRTESDPEN